MRRSTIIAICSLLIFSMHSHASGSGGPHQSDPPVVSQVDFTRYSGVWYEIAHSPNFFQRQCLQSVAEYKVLTSDSVSVHNICYKANSKISDISGTAKVTDPNVPAKLRVRFNFFARGDYWITHLDPDYKWAVVSGPKKKSIFILSREFPMNPSQRDMIVGRLKSEGFDIQNLIFDVKP